MSLIAFTTSNRYDGLENDVLTEYGQYESSWILDTGSSSHYADKLTRVKKIGKCKGV